jgi:hypothetical protein
MVIAENITAVPLLLKEMPGLVRRFVGDVSNRVKVIAGLHLNRPEIAGKVVKGCFLLSF